MAGFRSAGVPWPVQRTSGARPVAGERPRRPERGPRRARRGGRRQDRAAALLRPRRPPASASPQTAGRRVRDGAAVRGSAPALRADARPARRACPSPSATRSASAFGLSTGRRRPIASSSAWPRSACWPTSPAEQPLLCLVDDAQWLDGASAQVLGFVARRLLAESVGARVRRRASRADERELAGLPELRARRARRGRTRARCSRPSSRGALDDRVRDRIVAETRGNPLALLELPRGHDGRASSPAASGCRQPPPLSGPDRGAASAAARPRCRARRSGCCWSRPPSRSATRLLVWRAAERLGHRRRAAAPPRPSGLLESARGCASATRSCARPSTGRPRRRTAGRVHLALAEATDPEVDPDRRAWHRAQAAAGPDEDVAAELERSAGRAQARGGLAAAAAFLQRAVALTPRPGAARRARARRGAGQPPGRRVRRGARAAGRGRGRAARRARSAPASTCCAARSRSPRASAATRRRCCSRRPGASSRSTARSRARPTSTRGAPRCSPGRLASGRRPARGLARGPLRPAGARPAASRPTSCSTASPRSSPKGRAAAAPMLRRAARAFAADDAGGRRASAGAG